MTMKITGFLDKYHAIVAFSEGTDTSKIKYNNQVKVVRETVNIPDENGKTLDSYYLFKAILDISDYNIEKNYFIVVDKRVVIEKKKESSIFTQIPSLIDQSNNTEKKYRKEMLNIQTDQKLLSTKNDNSLKVGDLVVFS